MPDPNNQQSYYPLEDQAALDRFGNFLGNIMGAEIPAEQPPPAGAPMFNPAAFGAPGVPPQGEPPPGTFLANPTQRAQNLAAAQQALAGQSGDLAPNPTALEALNWGAGKIPEALNYANQKVVDIGARAVNSLFEPAPNSYTIKDGKPVYKTVDSQLAPKPSAKPSADASSFGDFGTGAALSPDYFDAPSGAVAGQQLGADAANMLGQYEHPLVTKTRNLAAQRAAQLSAMDIIQKEGIDGLKGSMDRLKAVYQKVDLDMAKLKVDPNRWEKETPAFTQALLLIAAGAFGFITKGKGSNPILGILDRAIQKDVDAQMVNYDLALKRAGMQVKGVEQQEYARAKMQAAMWDRAVHGLNAITENGKSELAIIQAQMMLDQAEEERLKWRTQAYLAGQKAMLGNPSNDGEKNTAAAFTAVNNLDRLFGFLERGPKSKAGRMANYVVGSGLGPLVTTETELYKDSEQHALGLILAKGALKEQLALQEGQAFIKRLPNISDNNKQQSTKMLAWARDIEDNLANNWGRMSPQQQQKMQPMMEAAVTRLNMFKQKAIEWGKK